MGQKRAFSLIEVLLVLGIIAVVTTMGFTISKKGMENAYNLYWYTGYIALHDGTRDFYKHSNDTERSDFSKYAAYMHKLLLRENVTVDDSATGHSITAPNGINFLFEQKTSYIKITMTIPQPKTRKNFPYKTVFVYNTASTSNTDILVYPANVTDTDTHEWLNLQNRVDLLPFAINDNRKKYYKEFFGFREAYCRTHGNESFTNTTDVTMNISCTGLSVSEDGTIVPINPRKAF